MKIISVKNEEIKKTCGERSNYIFGASDTGKKLLRSLMAAGVRVNAIWDNDILKQGKSIEGVPVISFEKMKEEKDFNLFLGSAYAMQEADRIDTLNNVTVYQVGRSRDELEALFTEVRVKFPAFVEGCRKNEIYYADDMSRRVSDAIIAYAVNYDGMATQKVVSTEEHYLIREVLEHLPDDAVFVDCGAFTGEFPIALIKNNISFQKCYCFEMEEGNCRTARQNIEKIMGAGVNRVEVVNSGIAEQNGILYFESNSANSKLTNYETDQKVKVVAIDSYFRDIKIDFVKMDIEGAELGALKGGINTIKRDRPVLAISVYHSLEDRVDIPKYLFNQLENYKFYLRQHSIWFAETVLYAVPANR